MSTTKDEKKAAYRPPMPIPRRPERPGETGWPSPTPLPAPQTEDVGRTLKQILDRLEAIEKRFERIEKALVEQRPL